MLFFSIHFGVFIFFRLVRSLWEMKKDKKFLIVLQGTKGWSLSGLSSGSSLKLALSRVINFLISHNNTNSLWIERGIRRSDARFLMGTQNFFFVPRSWQDEKHPSLIPYMVIKFWSTILFSQIWLHNRDCFAKKCQFQELIARQAMKLWAWLFHEIFGIFLMFPKINMFISVSMPLR